MYEYGNYAFHLELFSGEVSLLGVGLHFKFLAALAPEGWPFSDSGFSFFIQVSQNHLPLNSYFSPDLAHLILEILKNLKFWHTFRIFSLKITISRREFTRNSESGGGGEATRPHPPPRWRRPWSVPISPCTRRHMSQAAGRWFLLVARLECRIHLN